MHSGLGAGDFAMSDPFTADSYLDQVANEGAYHSSGDFTISLKAAIEKLGASQLPRESAWVLKVVQAGVALGSTAIDVKQGSMVTSFALAQPGALDLDVLQEAVLSTDFSGAAAPRHLAVALRAVGFGLRRPFRLSVANPERTESLAWDGEELRRETRDGDPSSAGVLLLEVEFGKGGRGRLFGSSSPAVRAAISESAELVEQASVCPVPLTLDGRRLDLLGFPSIQKSLPRQGAREALLCLAWSAPATEGNPGLRLPPGVDLEKPRFRLSNPLANPLTSGRAFLLHGNKKESAAEFLCRLSYHFGVIWSEGERAYQIRSVHAPPSLIHWVIDGVVCASVPEFRDGASARLDLYVSAAGLPTDISGMVPKLEGPVVRERLGRAKSFARGAIASVQGKLICHRHDYLAPVGLIGSGAALLTFLSGPHAWVVGLMFGIIFSPALGMMGIEAGRASRFSRQLSDDCLAKLENLFVKLGD
jgi:hypothetical protein